MKLTIQQQQDRNIVIVEISVAGVPFAKETLVIGTMDEPGPDREYLNMLLDGMTDEEIDFRLYSQAL